MQAASLTQMIAGMAQGRLASAAQTSQEQLVYQTSIQVAVVTNQSDRRCTPLYRHQSTTGNGSAIRNRLTASEAAKTANE